MDNKKGKYERATNVYERLDGKYEGRRQLGKHGRRWEYCDGLYNINQRNAHFLN